jgi:hypothetical protein
LGIGRGGAEERLPISLAALTWRPERYTKAYIQQLPAIRAELEREFRRMVPADVGVKLAHRITLPGYGYGADEVVQVPNAFNPSWASRSLRPRTGDAK